jgi:hypothetical protein
MDATIIYKQLNNIFEELYYLFQKSIIDVPEYTNRPEIQRYIIEFMDTVEIQCEWDMTDDERNELDGKYFEAGHNGVDAVFYPFDSNCEELNPINIQDILSIWENTLTCIQSYSENNEFIDKANELEERINNIKYY